MVSHTDRHLYQHQSPDRCWSFILTPFYVTWHFLTLWSLEVRRSDWALFMTRRSRVHCLSTAIHHIAAVIQKVPPCFTSVYLSFHHPLLFCLPLAEFQNQFATNALLKAGIHYTYFGRIVAPVWSLNTLILVVKSQTFCKPLAPVKNWFHRE